MHGPQRTLRIVVRHDILVAGPRDRRADRRPSVLSDDVPARQSSMGPPSCGRTAQISVPEPVRSAADVEARSNRPVRAHQHLETALPHRADIGRGRPLDTDEMTFRVPRNAMSQPHAPFRELLPHQDLERGRVEHAALHRMRDRAAGRREPGRPACAAPAGSAGAARRSARVLRGALRGTRRRPFARGSHGRKVTSVAAGGQVLP